SWDAAHRLIGISYAANPNMTTGFAYDGLGRRVATTTTVNGTPTTTFSVWCGHKLCQSQNADGSIARQYYREGEYLPSQQASLYYGPDQLGSVRDAYAASPLFNIPQAYDYDPTGNPILTPTQGPLTDFRYAGMFYHPDSGLYLTEHRAYDPRTGRWLSRDPLGEMSDPAANLYRYVGGNPISHIDALGLGITVSFGPPPGGYWSPGDPFPSPPGGSGSPCPPGDGAPPTVLTGADEASPLPPDDSDVASSPGVSSAPIQLADIAGDLEALGGGVPVVTMTPKGAPLFIFPNGMVMHFDLYPGQYLPGQGPHINLVPFGGPNYHIYLK
ncbi:MAG: RHS repeat-associated core domain-containing protein, partial [Stellaceae bacterium]